MLGFKVRGAAFPCIASYPSRIPSVKIYVIEDGLQPLPAEFKGLGFRVQGVGILPSNNG